MLKPVEPLEAQGVETREEFDVVSKLFMLARPRSSSSRGCGRRTRRLGDGGAGLGQVVEHLGPPVGDAEDDAYGRYRLNRSCPSSKRICSASAVSRYARKPRAWVEHRRPGRGTGRHPLGHQQDDDTAREHGGRGHQQVGRAERTEEHRTKPSPISAMPSRRHRPGRTGVAAEPAAGRHVVVEPGLGGLEVAGERVAQLALELDLVAALEQRLQQGELVALELLGRSGRTTVRLPVLDLGALVVGDLLDLEEAAHGEVDDGRGHVDGVRHLVDQGADLAGVQPGGRAELDRDVLGLAGHHLLPRLLAVTGISPGVSPT